MLSCLKRLLRELIVGLARGANHHKLNLGVRKDRIVSAMNSDALGGLLSKAGLQLPARGGWIAFQDGMEREQMRQSEHKRNVEGEAAETDTNNAGLDRCHRESVSQALNGRKRR